MAFEDLTLISCSYGTPLITLTMLKSYVDKHGEGPHNLLIMENSPDEATVKLLKEHNVPFIRNKGFTHATAVDLALKLCKTKYALLVDTDIIFERPIDKLYEVFKNSGAALMGTIWTHRGGHKLQPRVHPWYCFINIEDIQSKSINFYRPEDPRIANTNSAGFYQNVPENAVWSSNEFYDVGATFFEDITNNGLKIINANGIENFYTHYEGCSWYKNSPNKNIVQAGKEKAKKYSQEVKKHNHIDVSNSFKRKLSKISLIQPIFISDDNFFNISINSVRSLIEYVKVDKFRDFNLIFGGYCKSDEHWTAMCKLFSELGQIANTEVKMIRFDKNYGKAFVVNNLYEKLGSGCEYIFTMDSDIIFDTTCEDIFAKLINSARLFELATLKPFGMFALDQHEDNRHWHDQLDKKLEIGGLNSIWNSRGPGIAGGCLFISNHSWNAVGRYKVTGIYSGDDGALLNDMLIKGLFVAVTPDIYIIHPSQLVSESYVRWKLDSLKRTTSTGCNIDDEINIFEKNTTISNGNVNNYNVADKLIGRK